MTDPNLRAPFPYFGGKRRAAARIWEALGDPGGYVEPFAGSAAVLLARPRADGPRVETLNDADAWLVNTWRAIRLSPEAVADHLDGWPPTEADYHARLAWLQHRRDDDLTSWLEGDPEAHDARAAAWWLYVMACGIGDPFGGGPWHVEGDRLVDGRLTGHPAGDEGVNRELQVLGTQQGVHRALPYLGSGGRGTFRTTNEDGLHVYMSTLAARLRAVRITCGDWRRVLTPAAARATAGRPGVAILMDPPYSTSGDLYATTNRRGDDRHLTISEEVREWCLTEGRGYRIVLCGFDEEHDAVLDHGWAKLTGRAGSGSGMNADPEAGRRERLWASPECYGTQTGGLFDPHDFVSPAPDGSPYGKAEVRSSGWAN